MNKVISLASQNQHKLFFCLVVVALLSCASRGELEDSISGAVIECCGLVVVSLVLVEVTSLGRHRQSAVIGKLVRRRMFARLSRAASSGSLSSI